MKKYKLLVFAVVYGLLFMEMKLPVKDNPVENSDLSGAWKTIFTGENGKEMTGILVFAGNSFSETYYSIPAREFYSTRGGTWEIDKGGMKESVEFNTKDPSETGAVVNRKISVDQGNKILTYQGKTWQRADDGGPGKLAGAWLITGRERDGEMHKMTPGARRTMKILSGTRFQWIAYNVETKEFFGTGGGTYITKDGNYIENIEFFSRDGSRVGMSLQFEYELKNGAWHHKGHSSKGDPIYEIWTRRTELNIEG